MVGEVQGRKLIRNQIDYLVWVNRMQTTSKYEERILNDIRGLPSNLLPKISELIHFMKNEILSEYEKIDHEKGKFTSLEGIFHGKIEHTDEDILAAQIKLKEI